MDKREAFIRGIENLKETGFSKQLTLFSSLKVFFFYVYLCLIVNSKHVGTNIFFINGAIELKKVDPTNGKSQRVMIRRFSKQAKTLKEKTSLPTMLDKVDRIRLIIRALVSAPKGGHYLGRWLEFILLCEVFKKRSFTRICSFGHYDELTYWISILCKKYGIKYVMFQHGIVANTVCVPHKIHCDEVHVYNKYSEEVFRESIVENRQCCYCVDGFRSEIVFKHLKRKEGIKYIGIVDQTFGEWLYYVTKSVSMIDGCVAVVMLHPLTLKPLFEGRKDVVETREKYDNLDCIISDFSTLLLDYMSIGYNGSIICTNKEMCNSVFREYGFVHIKKEKIAKELPGILGIESERR